MFASTAIVLCQESTLCFERELFLVHLCHIYVMQIVADLCFDEA